MVRRLDENNTCKIQHFKDGEGEFIMKKIIETPEELYGKGRVFAHGILNKDCGVGWHIHEGDCEYFYILKGEGEYNDNGRIKTVRAGDICFTGDGEGHSITNRSEEPLEMIALAIYK